jgi:MoxR-like ATPase
MQERQVTIGDSTYKLEEPFLVLATQNPIDQEGTYTLPEAQVDRFMLKVVIDYPSRAEEQLILRQNVNGTQALTMVNPVASVQEISHARDLVRTIYMDNKIEDYILDIVFASRTPEKHKLEKLKPLISYGGSPRASINLALAAKANAFINKRGYVIPEDVRSIAKDVMRHRIGLTYEAEAENVNSEYVIDEILRNVVVP